MSKSPDLTAKPPEQAPVIPNPGSREAGDAGCTCPVLDNGHGKGIFCIPGRFWITGDCPLHDTAAWREQTMDSGGAKT